MGERKIGSCPKCGQPYGEAYANGGWFAVECTDCNYSVPPIYQSRDEAVKAWNERSGRSALEASK